MSVEQELTRYDVVRHILICVNEVRYLEEHPHRFFELSCVLEGNGHFHQGRQTIELTPGTLVLANPDEPHSYASQPDKPMVILTAKIHKMFLRRYIEYIPRLVFSGAQITQLPQAQLDALKKSFFGMAVAYFQDDDFQQFYVVGEAALLLGQMVALLDWELVKNPDSTDKELAKGRAQRLLNYIDENYRQKITLSMLAEREGISTTYLSHFFRKEFGVSFQQYLSSHRLEKALVLIRNKNISMVDICMSCGFSDSRYLEAACQRMFGCSVSEYRKRLGEHEEPETEQKAENMHRCIGRKESLEIIKNYLGSEKLDKHS